MPTISYKEIEYSEKTGQDVTDHKWDWNPINTTLTHYIDGVFEDEYIGDTATKMLKDIMK